MVNSFKILAAVLVLLAIIAYGALGKRFSVLLRIKSAQTPQNESIVVEAIAAALVVIVATGYYITSKPDFGFVSGLGVALFFGGGLLQIFTKKHIGHGTLQDTFSTIPKEGAFRLVRHPSKTSLLLLLIGYCLALNSIWALILCLALFLPAVLFRIAQEEKVLAEQYDELWRAYAQDTKKLVPGLL